MLDFHNHLTPGVDDGAADVNESRAGIEAMVADGITGIITTPHIAASMVERGTLDKYLAKIEEGWSVLQNLVATEFPKLRIARGFEVMLDVPHPNLENPLLRLAGTKFVLFEFPFMNIPPNSVRALFELREAGWIPILAHPERYVNMEGNIEMIEQWRDAGAYMQINAGSIVGQYGARAKKLAWSILEAGQADYMCSDYHSRGKTAVAAAFAQIRKKGMEVQADTLIRNAKKVVSGDKPLQLEPFTAKPASPWKKVIPWA
jgi:protein-tyrosine phosphatase